MAANRPKAPDFRSSEAGKIFLSRLREMFPARHVESQAVRFGLSGQTIRAWLNGRNSPEMKSIADLAKKTDKPLSWWLGASAPTLAELAPRSPVTWRPVAGRTAASDRHLSRVIEVDMDGEVDEVIADAIDPRVLIVEGKSAWPLAAHGQAVVFDAAREAEVRDGDVVVVELGEELLLKRRHTTPDGSICYQSINMTEDFPPVVVRADQERREYPVVEIILRLKRRTGRVAEGDDRYGVQESEDDYGEESP